MKTVNFSSVNRTTVSRFYRQTFDTVPVSKSCTSLYLRSRGNVQFSDPFGFPSRLNGRNVISAREHGNIHCIFCIGSHTRYEHVVPPPRPAAYTRYSTPHHGSANCGRMTAERTSVVIVRKPATCTLCLCSLRNCGSLCSNLQACLPAFLPSSFLVAFFPPLTLVFLPSLIIQSYPLERERKKKRTYAIVELGRPEAASCEPNVNDSVCASSHRDAQAAFGHFTLFTLFSFG